MMSGWTLAVLLVAGIAGWAWMRWFEWRHVFRPRRTHVAEPTDAGMAFENVSFMAEDAVLLHGWWIPGDEAAGTVLYCHGNGDNIFDLVSVAEDLHSLGVNVFLWDYRGYGESRGIPTEKGTYRDARAAFEVVRARHGGEEEPPVWVIGRSLGGAVAVQLACDKPVRGLVLESTFTSAQEVARHWFPSFPTGLFQAFRYDSISKIARLEVPVLVAHSPDDRTIPFTQGRALFHAARGTKTFVALRGDHMEAGWRTCPAYWNRVVGMIRAAAGPGKRENGISS